MNSKTIPLLLGRKYSHLSWTNSLQHSLIVSPFSVSFHSSSPLLTIFIPLVFLLLNIEPVDKDFWNRVAHIIGGGSGPRHLAGWVLAFVAFDDKGHYILNDVDKIKKTNDFGTMVSSLPIFVIIDFVLFCFVLFCFVLFCFYLFHMFHSFLLFLFGTYRHH